MMITSVKRIKKLSNTVQVVAGNVATAEATRALIGAGAKVRVADPQGKREGEALLPGVAWCDNAYQATQGADAVVILTEWNEYRGLDLERMVRKMATPRMADLRNVYSRQEALDAGFVQYTSIGR